jgi:hypothetical protein
LPREQAIPHCLHAGDAAAAKIVDQVMAVVDLDEPDAFEPLKVVARDRPLEVGVVHVRHAPGLPDRVHIALDDVDDGRAVLRLDLAGHVEAVDVERLVPRRSVTSSPLISRNCLSAHAAR